TPAFNQLDANGDGKETKSELLAYYRRFAGPFKVPSGGNRNDSRYEYFLRLQTDQALLGARRARGRNSESINGVPFKLLHTDGNGKRRKAELAAAEKMLMKRDRNDDEIITPDEILQATVSADDETTLALAELRLALAVQEYELASSRSARRSGGPF